MTRTNTGRHRPERVGEAALTVSRLLARIRAEGRRLRLDWPAGLVSADYDACTTTVLPLQGAASW